MSRDPLAPGHPEFASVLKDLPAPVRALLERPDVRIIDWSDPTVPSDLVPPVPGSDKRHSECHYDARTGMTTMVVGRARHIPHEAIHVAQLRASPQVLLDTLLLTAASGKLIVDAALRGVGNGTASASDHRDLAWCLAEAHPRNDAGLVPGRQDSGLVAVFDEHRRLHPTPATEAIGRSLGMDRHATAAATFAYFMVSNGHDRSGCDAGIECVAYRFESDLKPIAFLFNDAVSKDLKMAAPDKPPSVAPLSDADALDVAAVRGRVKERISGKVASLPDLRVLANGDRVVRLDVYAGRSEPAAVFVTFPTASSAKLADAFADDVTQAVEGAAMGGGKAGVDVTVAGRWRKGTILEGGRPSYWFEGADAAVGANASLPLLDAAPSAAARVAAARAGVMALDEGAVALRGGKVLAIIGSAGRTDDKPKMSGALFDAMLDSSRQIVRSTGATGLVSGGAAWADHIAVALALEGAVDPKRLTLFLPAKLEARGFATFPSDRFDPGTVANRHHADFGRLTGRDPIAEIHEVISRGAVFHDEAKGFKGRNSDVARKADGVLAFTFGSGEPWMPVVSKGDYSEAGLKRGGTSDTWDKSNAPVKIHVTLAPVQGRSASRSQAAPVAAVSAPAVAAGSPVEDLMRVVNIRDYPNNSLPPDVLYVGRGRGGVPGDLGNPFVVGRDGTAAETVAKFRPYFQEKLRDPAFEAKVMAATRGKTAVACFCANGSGNFACHGTVIAEEVAKRRAVERGAAPSVDQAPGADGADLAARSRILAASRAIVTEARPGRGPVDDSVAVGQDGVPRAQGGGRPVLTDRDVAGFAGADRVFSNMAGAVVRWGDGITPERQWPNVEVPYHVARTSDPAIRARILSAADAGFSKAIADGQPTTDAAEVAGKFVKKVWKDFAPGEADVDRRKAIMRALVFDKYGRDPDAGTKLLATGNGRIEERNGWGDVYWGVSDRDIPSRNVKAGDGLNTLGEITMEARTILSRSGPEALLAASAAIRVELGDRPGKAPLGEVAAAAPGVPGVASAKQPAAAFVQAGPGSVLSGSGDMFGSGAEAIVNTVNCVGSMGAGIAEVVRSRFPVPYAAYRKDVGIGLSCDGGADPSMGPSREQKAPACCQPGETCGSHKVRPGEVTVRPSGKDSPKYIIDFPSKRHWKDNARMSDVEAGLPALADAIRRHGIKSVAVPPIGCGNGGLDWAVVGPKVRAALGSLEGVDVRIYDGIGAAIPPLAQPAATREAAPSRAVPDASVAAPASSGASDPAAVTRLEATLRAAKSPTTKDPDSFMLILSAEQAAGKAGDALGRVASVVLPVRNAGSSRRLAGGYLSVTAGYAQVAGAVSATPDGGAQFVSDLRQGGLSSAANAKASSAAFERTKLSEPQRA